jgi:hypothetical protein
MPPNGAGLGSQFRRTLKTVRLISFSYGQLSPGFQPGLFHEPQGRTGPLLKSSDVSLGRLALAAGGLALSAVLALAASVGPARANGAEPNPLSVVQALMDAERETDLELALSLFAKDAVIVNVTGGTIESAQLPRFLELDMWLNESFALEQATVERNRVTWTKAITAPFYEQIGVAPIRFAFAADVRNGKINSIIAHVPLEEIVRIEAACGRQTPEPRIYDNPCSAFIQRIAAQSAFATPAAARDRVEMNLE